MTLAEAIATLRRLIGWESLVKFQQGPMRVVDIDFFAVREKRCILGRVGDEGLSNTVKRAVVDITYQAEYHDADRLIAEANPDTLREALGQRGEDSQ